MYRYVFSAFLALLSVFSAGAQEAPSRQWFLGLEGGAGCGIYRDLGLSPITYRGLELAPAFSLDVHAPLWQHQLALGGWGGGYGYQLGFAAMQNYGGLPSVSLSSVRKVLDHSHLTLYCGGRLSEMMDIRYQPSLGNAANSFGNLVSLSFVGRAECRLRRWMLQAQVAVALPSAVMRPGFAYIDNFNQDIASPTANTFDQYRWYVSGLNFTATQLGVTRLLPNGNRLTLRYDWHYLHSRTAPLAPYVLQQASHSLVVRLDFAINN